MEKLFDGNGVKEMWTGSMDLAVRFEEVARSMFETQVATAQKASVEAINRSFDLLREATRMADETQKAIAEQCRKAVASVPAA
jgi:hypothetical protein